MADWPTRYANPTDSMLLTAKMTVATPAASAKAVRINSLLQTEMRRPDFGQLALPTRIQHSTEGADLIRPECCHDVPVPRILKN